MVNAAAQYRRALKKKLRCSAKEKERLLEGFDQTLSAYLEEHGDPAMGDLSAAFGPPEEMAEVIMEDVPPQEQTRYQRQVVISKILTCILAALLVFFTVYTWIYKDVGLNINDNAGTIDAFSTPTTHLESGDDFT